MNGHDPYAYLKDVLTRLPAQRASEIDQLLPHRNLYLRWHHRRHGYLLNNSASSRRALTGLFEPSLNPCQHNWLGS